MNNLFTNLPSDLPAELVEVLAESDSVRIERIVSTGQASREGFWYDQDRHEWVDEAKLMLDRNLGPTKQ